MRGVEGVWQAVEVERRHSRYTGGKWVFLGREKHKNPLTTQSRDDRLNVGQGGFKMHREALGDSEVYGKSKAVPPQMVKAIVRTLVEDSPLRRALAEHFDKYKGLVTVPDSDSESSAERDTAAGAQV